VVADLVREVGTEEFFSPDLEHGDGWLTDSQENSLSVHMNGLVTLGMAGMPDRYMSDLPYAQLNELLMAFGQADWEKVETYTWVVEHPACQRPLYLHATRTLFSNLHRAACLGDIEWAQSEIDAGADINAGSDEGSTPLHEAASAAEMKMCRFLLDAGANVNSVDHSGSTPLDYAEYGHESVRIGNLVARIERLLKKHGGYSGHDDTSPRARGE